MILSNKNNFITTKKICESTFHFKYIKPTRTYKFIDHNNMSNFILKHPPILHYVQKNNESIHLQNESLHVQKAGCIIFDTDLKHVLLVKNRMSFEKGEDKYGLPKGSVKINELPRHAAERELYEETGLVIKINSHNNVILVFDTLYYILFLNKNNFNTFKPIDNIEIIATEWIDVNKVKNFTLNRSLFKVVQIWDNVFNK
jgi:8-oxo-dGTP pyrophosphatase MutT (NUDIX family)